MSDTPRHVGGNIGDSAEDQAKEKALQEKLSKEAREKAAEQILKMRESGEAKPTQAVPRRKRS